MNNTLKKTIKFACGTCAALGVVTLAAVVASSSALKITAEGLKAGGRAMKQTMRELRTEEASIPAGEDETDFPCSAGAAAPAEEETAAGESPADSEN